MDRYEAGRGDEFEPGSDGRVLRNKLGIVDPQDAEEVETVFLAQAYRRAFETIETDTVLDTVLLRRLHFDWLKRLYPFAGELRKVDVSKDGFLFAKAEFLPKGLQELDGLLARLTPCQGCNQTRLSIAIASTHIEFEFLHPFREGNGRLGRWVADIMATQAGRLPLDWGFDQTSRRESYFAALRRGYLRDYGPLTEIVEAALR